MISIAYVRKFGHINYTNDVKCGTIQTEVFS